MSGSLPPARLSRSTGQGGDTAPRLTRLMDRGLLDDVPDQHPHLELVAAAFVHRRPVAVVLLRRPVVGAGTFGTPLAAGPHRLVAKFVNLLDLAKVGDK